MSLSWARPFAQSTWRGVTIFASLTIEELTTKFGHEAPKPQGVLGGNALCCALEGSSGLRVYSPIGVIASEKVK